jgi:hypothetical protein
VKPTVTSEKSIITARITERILAVILDDFIRFFLLKEFV